MDYHSKFIFSSKTRWPRVWFLIKALFAFGALAFFLVFANLSYPLKPKFPAKDLPEIINQISTEKEKEIPVRGAGPQITLERNGERYYLNLTETSLKKTVYLTFDDGPDPIYTEAILEILKKQNVKATFFLIGKNVYRYPKIAKEIAQSGHAIGAHTFTHTPEDKLLFDGNNFQMREEFDLTQKMITTKTNISTRLFRVPYLGADNKISENSLVLATNALQRDYKVITSTVDSQDWHAQNSNEILIRVMEDESENPVILLHDGGGNRSQTVAALPQMITYYRLRGYRFSTVEEMFPLQTVQFKPQLTEKTFSLSIVSLYTLFNKFPKITANIFVLGLFAFGIHSILTALFAVIHYLKIKRRGSFNSNFKPKVSVIIPSFNEEKVIAGTIKSILAQSYENFELIIVNDGSTDKTENKILRFVKEEKVRYYSQANKGKFEALNFGISKSEGQIIVTIDADTQIQTGALHNFARHFKNKKIGAVAGNVKVGNKNNLLTILQDLDYRMAINLERRAFDILDSIFVVPGAVSAWRKSAILEVGGFSSSTLTEDAELGMRLKKAYYKIVYEPQAIGLTEAPQSLNGFLKQRFRWTFGTFQTLWLHKMVIFNRKYKLFGLLILPYVIFVQIPTMAIAPFIELAAIPLAIFVSIKLVVTTFLILFVIRFLLFIVSSKLAEEDLSLAKFVLPYRFLYQLLWYFIFDISILNVLKGSIIRWNKLPHFGYVRLSKNIETTYSSTK